MLDSNIYRYFERRTIVNVKWEQSPRLQKVMKKNNK